MKNGWKKESLWDIGTVLTGKWDANHATKDGQYRFFTCAAKPSRCDTTRFSGECMILPGNGANVGEVYYYSGEFDAYQRTYVIGGIQIEPRFLFHHLQAFWMSQNEGKQFGSATNYIKMGNFKDYIVSFPESLPEQRRIVGILDEAFDGIATAKANAEQNFQNARALFEIHLNAVLTQRGDGWVEKKLGERVRFIDYRGKTPKKTESGLRLITAKNVKMGYVQETPLEFVAPETYDDWMTRGIPQRGDVLFTTEAPLANIAQLDTDEKVVFAQRIITMQSDASELDSTFLKYLLLSQPVQRRIHAKGTGATVKGIKASLLKTIEISFPESVTVQGRIVTQLDALSEETQRLESIYQRKLAALDELKKSLLHQAFSGELQGSRL